jgi:hypothetical protein
MDDPASNGNISDSLQKLQWCYVIVAGTHLRWSDVRVKWIYMRNTTVIFWQFQQQFRYQHIRRPKLDLPNVAEVHTSLYTDVSPQTNTMLRGSVATT